MDVVVVDGVGVAGGAVVGAVVGADLLVGKSIIERPLSSISFGRSFVTHI